MNISNCFPSNYIAAEDLQGRDVDVQIADCRMEPIKQDSGPDKEKPVLYFNGHGRGLVLNVTNAQAIASLYGDETDAWRGQWITLYPPQCQFGNRMVDCIRVRPFSPQTTLGQPHQDPQQPPATMAAAQPQQPANANPAQQQPATGTAPVQF